MLLFNKFAVFILYGLLSVAVITLAQPGQGKQGNNGESGGGTGASPISSPKVPPIVPNNKCPPPLSSNRQMIIGYVQQPKNTDPKTIQWSYYTYINLVVSSGQAPNFQPPDVNFLGTFVQAKRSYTTKILLSIRNFDPSLWPTLDQDYKNFADNLINTTRLYNLDGVDIEYPGMRGRYCNNAWDSTKDQFFLGFLTYLQQQLQLLDSKNLMLTVGIDTISGLDVKSIDILNIEPFHYSFYDNYNATNPLSDSSKVRADPNAPFSNAYLNAYNKWNVIGIENSKIAMGVDLGNTFQIVDNREISTKQSGSTGIYEMGPNNLNDYSNLTPITFCPNNDKLKLYSFPWNQLFENSILSSSGDAQCYNKDPGWQSYFDSSTNTPVLTRIPQNPQNQNLQNPKFIYYVSYEDFNSLNYKLNSTFGRAIGGISISDISYDTNDTTSLINYMQSIRNGQSASTTPTDNPDSQKPQGTSSGDVNPSSSVASTNDSPNKDDRKPGVIAGAVIGSVFGLIIIGGIAFFGYKNKDKLPFGQNKYSKDMLYNPGTNMNQGMIIPENSQRTILQDTAAIPVAPSYVTAMFDFMGKEENDLSFKKGDKIEVLERGDGPNDWWVGRVNGAVGEFPGNYVKE